MIAGRKPRKPDRREGDRRADRRRVDDKRKAKLPQSMDDVLRAKAAFDGHRDRQEALGFEVCLVVVGYVSGRDPFRLLGRISADTGTTELPDPPLTQEEMQPVAFAAKMALAKVLAARRRRR